jgi:ribosomal protein L28
MPRINLLSLRPSFPPILTLPSTSTGNNVPKSLHKTRRTWKANVHRRDVEMRVVPTARATATAGTAREGEREEEQGKEGMERVGFVLKGVKMDMRTLRTFKKAGGVEGCLVRFLFG